MEINKKLVDYIILKKNVALSDFLVEFKYVHDRNDKQLPLYSFNVVNFLFLEDVIYTVYSLQREGLTKHQPNSISIPDLDLTKFTKDEIDNEIHFIMEEMKKIYGYRLHATIELVEYKKRGYKTDQQQISSRGFWLPIIIAIVGAVVAMFIAFVPYWF